MTRESEPKRPLSVRLGWSAFRIVVLSYIGVLGFLYFFQTWLIFPGHATQGEARAQVVAPGGAELVPLGTASGESIVALYGPALEPDGTAVDDPRAHPTVLFFYGNGDCLANNLSQFGSLRRLGSNVLIPEYVGYGMSSGSPSETGCYETASAAYEYLRSRSDVDPDRIVASGWSLGAAVATDLASRSPVEGLAIFSAFTSMTDMGRRSYPFIPIGLLLTHRFETLEKLRRVTCPILIGHSHDDTLIPYEMSDRLADVASAPLTRFSLDRGDHNEFFAIEPAHVFGSIGAFLASLEPPRASRGSDSKDPLQEPGR